MTLYKYVAAWILVGSGAANTAALGAMRSTACGSAVAVGPFVCVKVPAGLGKAGPSVGGGRDAPRREQCGRELQSRDRAGSGAL